MYNRMPWFGDTYAMQSKLTYSEVFRFYGCSGRMTLYTLTNVFHRIDLSVTPTTTVCSYVLIHAVV